MIQFLENVFSTLIARFLGEIQKIFEVQKIRKYGVFIGKKTYSSFQKLSLQNGKAQNKLEVAGRLVVKSSWNIFPRVVFITE